MKMLKLINLNWEIKKVALAKKVSAGKNIVNVIVRVFHVHLCVNVKNVKIFL